MALLDADIKCNQVDTHDVDWLLSIVHKSVFVAAKAIQPRALRFDVKEVTFLYFSKLSLTKLQTQIFIYS